ncbi:MAG: hypothetical protein KKA42_12075 [candidate division Zixibacteria bacterium]|nr:hypothetical protein [candidate division Zixibacteria bacterium]
MRSRTRYLAIVPALTALLLSTGCSINRRAITGQVEARQSHDTLTIQYDISVRDGDLDSVAIQLLQDYNRRLVRYDALDRVRDSLYRSLGDSLDCCFPMILESLLLPGQPVRSLDSAEYNDLLSRTCWWMLPPSRIEAGVPRTFFGSHILIPGHNTYIDSIIARGPLDSLRKHSIPCSWSLDTGPQHTDIQTDSILYRRNPDSVQNNRRFTGTLQFDTYQAALPEAYCIKYYGGSGSRANRHANPLRTIWEGVLPPEPQIRMYRFREEGGFVGMAGGLGASTFSRGGLPSTHAGTDRMPALTIGFLYYSPSTIYQVSAEMCGMDSTGEVPALGTFSPINIRHFPFTRNSRGLSAYGGLEFTAFKADVDFAEINNHRFGLELGAGYDTDFNRLTYSYHTNQGGYHEVELLVGMVALEQGKAGVKLSFLQGDLIRFATIQAYMENRIGFETLEFRRPLSLPAQALVYAGMITAWALVY